MPYTEDWTLQDIFKNKNPNVFRIPIYQRGYDWESKHIDDFWEDLKEADTEGGGISGSHFFGLVYTQVEDEDGESKVRNKFHRVIDGQQRLITSAIFFLCARDIFYKFSTGVDFFCPKCDGGLPFDEQKRISLDVLDRKADTSISDVEDMLFRWDKTADPAAPNTDQCILELSRINKSFFVNFLIKKEKPEDKIKKMKQHSKNYSEDKIFDAYGLLYKKLMELKESYPVTLPDGSTQSFFVRLKSMVDSLQTLFALIHITVKDEEEAYEMFNLVNNRGVPLQNADLIKHRIFLKLYKELANLGDRDTKLNDYDETWTNIVNAITGKKEGDYKIENFIHHYLVTFHKYETKVKQVLSVTNEIMVNQKTTPSKLLTEMKSVADDFNTLRNPYEGTFSQVEKVQYYLQKIRDFDSTVLYSVILAAFYKFWQQDNLGKKKEFGNILQLCFRYFVRNKTLGSASATSIDRKMKIITNEIMNNNWDLSKIKAELIKPNTKTYTPKSEFEQAFVNSYQVKDETVATYLLEELENDIDPLYFKNTNKITVEHIMPRSITKWKDDIIANEGYTGTEDDKTKHAKAYWKEHWLKLGNLTLLHGLKNTKAGNKKFAYKLPIYKNDGYAITAEIEANYTQWSSTELLQRHNDLCTKLLAMFDIENFPT